MRKTVRSCFVTAAALVLSSGCARNLTIVQDDYVNNAMQKNLDASARVGQTLEVAVVCVYPKDLVDGPNMVLDPDGEMTSRDWFEKAPLVGDTQDKAKAEGRFWLPGDQIFVLTDKSAGEVYGKKIFAALRGAKKDGQKLEINGVQYNLFALHDDKAVIYVFPKFVGEGGGVLPVKPAKFHPPGAYKAGISVHIGVDPGRPNDGQYIEVNVKRELHGKEE